MRIIFAPRSSRTRCDVPRSIPTYEVSGALVGDAEAALR